LGICGDFIGNGKILPIFITQAVVATLGYWPVLLALRHQPMRGQFFTTTGGMEHAMDITYVEYRNGAYHLTNTRVTLDSLVYTYREGHSPETIAQAFWLGHEQV
jgi:hypothetical protein